MEDQETRRKVDERVFRLSKLFDALSNTVRLQILLELQDGELCVKETAERLGRNPDAISRYLKTLRDNDLVSSITRGNYRFYSLKRPDLLEEILKLYSLLCREEHTDSDNSE